MPFVPNGNVAEAHLRYLIDLEECENTLYFSTVETVGIAELENLADYLSGWWATNIAPLLSTAIVYRETYVVSLASPTAPGVVSLSEAGEQGDVTGVRLPNESAPCISFRSLTRGRSGRGRNYLPPPAQAQMADANNISVALANAYTAAYEELITTPPPDSWQWIVYSRYTAGAPRATGVAYPVVAVGFVDRKIDSQRKRKPDG